MNPQILAKEVCPIDNRSHQKTKQGWANNKKEKGNMKRQPDPLFECEIAFDKTRSYNEENFSNS